MVCSQACATAVLPTPPSPLTAASVGCPSRVARARCPSSVFTSAERPVIRIEGGSCQGGFGPRASGAASVWK